MPEDIYRYHAKNKQGEYVDGEIEATTQDQALDKLEAQGLFVISITAASETPSPSVQAPPSENRV